MTEQKQPQAGEYWQKEDTRVCVIGTKKNGLTVGEMQSGTLIPFMSIYGWRHLPDCDSFDWQPEVWPKWYVAGASVYRRNSKTESYLICDDGREVKQCCQPETYDAKWCFTEITEAEALARVKPVESPKRVPVRLWVSHRLESEHGDWPMRCTPASEEFDDGGRSPWLEIKHDGYKFFVEVQQ